MSRKTLKYRIIKSHNPRTGEEFLRGVLTDREVFDLDQVMRHAKDAHYVRGQIEDLKGGFIGCLEAIRDLCREGKWVNIGDWLRFHGELTGKIDPQTLQPGKGNSYRMIVKAGKEYDANLRNFILTNIDAAASTVRVDSIMSAHATSLGILLPGRDILVSGMFLAYRPEIGDKVTAYWTDADGAKQSVGLVPVKDDLSRMTFNWPDEFDGLPPKTRITFAFQLHGREATGKLQLRRRVARIAEEE